MASSFEPAAPTRRPAAEPDWIAAFGARSGRFVGDRRFAGGPVQPETHVEVIDRGAAIEAAWQEGHAAGAATAAKLAEAEARQHAAALETGREGLRLAFARLDEVARRELADRLAATVAGLCEATLAPLALDHEALRHRCEAAAAQLGETPDRLKLHLHPDDIRYLAPDVAAGWAIVADPALVHGTIRLEGPDGGICDGPAEWAAALRTAFAAC